MIKDNLLLGFLIICLVIFPLLEGTVFDYNRSLLFLFTLPLSLLLIRQKLKIDKLTFIIFLIFLLNIILIPFSVNPLKSLEYYCLYFTYIIVFLVFKNVNYDNTFIRQALTICILTTSCFLVLFSFGYLFFDYKPNISSLNFIYANFGHNHLIDFLLFSLPMAVSLLLKETKKKKIILYFVVTVLLLGGFIISFSRIGIILAFAGMAMVFFLKQGQGRKKAFLYLLILFLLSASFFIFPKKIQEKILRPLTYQDRINYWLQALKGVSEKPLSGYGLGTFEAVSFKNQNNPGEWSSFVHNHYLQFFVETGVISGLFFTLIIIIILRKCFKITVKHKDPLFAGIFIGILLSAVHNFVDFDWQFISIFLLFWVLAGFLLQKYPTSRLFKSNIAPGLILLLSIACFLLGITKFISDICLLTGVDFFKKMDEKTSKKLLYLSATIYPSNEKHVKADQYFYDNGNIDVAYFMAKINYRYDQSSWRLSALLGDIYARKRDFYNSEKMYLKALTLNPVGSPELYEKLAKTYKTLGDESGEVRILRDYFDKTKKIKEFWPVTEKAADVYMLTLDFFNKRDVFYTFEVLERMEHFNGWENFEGLGWERQRKIENILKSYQKDDLSKINDPKKGKYFFWLVSLSAADDSLNDLKEKKKWLEEALVYEPANNDYAYLLRITQTLWEAANKIYWTDYEEAVSILEPLAKELASSGNKPVFKNFYYAQVFDFLASAQAEMGNTDAIKNWKKAIEFNNQREDYHQKLIGYLKTKKDNDELKKAISACLKLLKNQEYCN